VVVTEIAPPAIQPAPQADLSAAPAPLAAAEPQPLQSAVPPTETLPVEQLRAVVETAGLQWVQSDPERVEQAQRKARQAPQPRQVPRERKARVAQEEGPLVLVETRQALPRLDLPENDRQAS
jgi:ribonuclease E